MKELLLYGSIFDNTVSQVVSEMIAAGDSDVTLRVNSEGGSVEGAWSVITKWAGMKGKKTVKVDGGAHSMAAFLLAYSDDVEAADYARFTLHRAAYDSYFEKSERFDEARKASLNEVNASLRKALEARVNAEKFLEVTGVTMDALFSIDNRIDVELTAKQAKQIGLIDRIVKITPTKKAEIDAYSLQMAAKLTPETEKPKNDKMTLEELKAQHPEIFAQAVAFGREEELARVGAWSEFMDSDSKAVKAGIDSGKAITQKEIIALTRAEFAKSQIASAEAESAEAVVTTEAGNKPAAKAEDEKAKADFVNELNASLGIKNTATV